MFSKKKSSNNNNNNNNASLPESQAKRDFLHSQNQASLPFPVEYYEPILEHYKSKYGFQGMETIINGSTPLGQAMFAENMAKLQAEIDEMTNAEFPYALQLQQYWVIPTGNIPAPFFLNRTPAPKKEDQPGFDFHEHYDELYQALLAAGFLDANGGLKPLDANQQRDLNILCQGLNCKAKLDEYQQLILESLEALQARCCLTQTQAVKEIKAIQANLNPDESVIYFFTNNHRQGPAHFEFFIITQDNVIKPVHWFLENNVVIDYRKLSNVYYTDLTHFILPYINPMLLQPQVGKVECGTLGVLYLKELLKHNAQQLQESSLTFSIYHESKETYGTEVQKVNLFIPSPQVLRYSQSSFYNSAVRALFENSNYENLKYKADKYKIKTLKKILQDSIKIAKAKGDLETVNANTELLKCLPEFRKKWIAEYENSMAKRTTMQGEKYNLYLAYSTHRFERLQQEPSDSHSDEPKSLLQIPGVDSSSDEELQHNVNTPSVSANLNNNNNNTKTDTDREQEQASSDIAPRVTSKSPTSIIYNNPLYKAKDRWQNNPLYESQNENPQNDSHPQRRNPKK